MRDFSVFYSWQSGLPNSTNRGFIEEALNSAVKAIRDDGSIKVELTVDRDTAGVPGSPDIAETILGKIRQSQVFVCEVSIINRTSTLHLVEILRQDDEFQRALGRLKQEGLDEDERRKLERYIDGLTPRPTPNPNVLVELGCAMRHLDISKNRNLVVFHFVSSSGMLMECHKGRNHTSLPTH